MTVPWENIILPELPIEQWLTAEAVAAEFLVTAGTVSKWRRDGIIPPIFLKEVSKRKFKFHPEVIPALNKIIEAFHSRRSAGRRQPPCAVAAE
jgi:hypothetical protein